MRTTLGESRSRFARDHALISPDSHERTTLPHWPGAELIYLVTPQLGAQFTMFLCNAAPDMAVGEAPGGAERFVMVREGSFTLTLDGAAHDLAPEGYAFLPAGQTHKITTRKGGVLIVLERAYLPLAGRAAPAPVISSIAEVARTPMKGDAGLMLQKLLPQDAAFDCEVNVMDFAPGASLPYVETHFMEHGLMMLNGGGIYRLADAWYPVAEHDAIWMGPYCPQWFGAIGRGNARYLIYKNWNRDPLG